jgi:hypothetical protein
MVHQHSREHKERRYKQFEEKMSEKDTARAIVKSLSIRDIKNGDIIFHEANLSNIKLALIGGKYSIDKPTFVTKHGKRKQKVERLWFDIDETVADKTVDVLENGQVLNCPFMPCWWR